MGGMAMQIRETKQFGFSVPVGEITYNFMIPAETKAEAIEKLRQGLEQVLQELKASTKVGVN